MRWKPAAGLILAAGMLAGCTTLENEIWGNRYGPSPVLVAQTVQLGVERQAAVVAAIVAGARGIAVDPVTGVPLGPVLPAPGGSREAWYQIILTGFNVIDDACMAYIDDLWILERRKTRNSTIIHAAGAATAAILSAKVTPSTAAALLVISQAFGLAGILNNAVADTYLYTQNAATVKKLVRKTTLAYRTDLAANIGATEVAYPIASPGAAYHHMRDYLTLCLPPSIQEQIDDLVTTAKAVPEGVPRVAGGGPAAAPVVMMRRGAASPPVTSLRMVPGI